MRLQTVLLATLLASIPASSWAQPTASSGSSAASTSPPPAQAPALDARGLPPGHPPIDAMGPSRPSDGPGPADDPALPPGTLVVEASGLDGPVLETLDAALVEVRRTNDTTSSQTRSKQNLDASGIARFDGLPQPPGVLYRVVVPYEDVPYASSTFKLAADRGKRVPVKLFPITEDIDRARIGVQAFVYIEPRDHHIHVEQLFRFSNLSDTTWRGMSIPVRLPTQASDVRTGEEPGPLELSAVAGQGVLVRGVVPPGNAEIAFQYQLPYPNQDQARLHLGLPPRVGAVRVVAATGPGLSLHVDGLGPPSPGSNEKGQRLLIAAGAVPPGGDQIESLRVTLSGLPAGGRARWIALFITVLAMVGGIGGTIYLKTRTLGLPARPHEPEDQRQAVLEAISTLERRRLEGDIGQESYDVQREGLLAQLAQLLPETSSNSSTKDTTTAESPGENVGDKTLG